MAGRPGLPEIGGVSVERFPVHGAVVEGLEQTILPLLGLSFGFGLTLGLLALSGGERGRLRLWLAWGAHTSKAPSLAGTGLSGSREAQKGTATSGTGAASEV